MKFWKIILPVAALTLLVPIPFVRAVPDGVAPSLVCSSDMTASSLVEYSTFGNGISSSDAPAGLSAVDANGNFYFGFSERTKSGTGTNDFRSFIRKVTPTCGILDFVLCSDAQCPHVTGDTQLILYDFIIDNGGRLAAIWQFQGAGAPANLGFIETFDTGTGIKLHQSFDFALLSPSWTDPRSITSVRNGTNDVDYIVSDSDASRVARVNSNLTMTKWITTTSSGATRVMCCSLDETLFYMTRVTSGTAVEIQARLVSSGATTGVVQAFGNARTTTLNDIPPEIGYVDSSKVYILNAFSGSAIEQTQRRYQNTVPVLAAQSSTTLAFSSIHDGAYRQTLPKDYSLDGADNILGCGSYTNVDATAYFAYYGTTDMRWNITYPTLIDSVAYACKITPTRTIGVAIFHDNGAFDNNIRFQRYSGGDAVAYNFPRFAVEFPTEEEVSSPNPINQARDVFATGWGISTDSANWLFTLTIVGFIVFVSAKYRSPLITGILGFIGVGLAVALGFAPVYLILTIIFLIVAIAGTTLFERDDD